MSIIRRITDFIICLALICVTALCVNKTVFGHKFSSEKESIKNTQALVDSVSTDADGTMIIHTSGLCDTEGYAGKVPLDIYIEDGRIKNIVALPNDETPSFFQYASELFAHWIGKTPEEVRSQEVDAVSGATYSSNAIIDNVNAGIDYYLSHKANDSNTAASQAQKHSKDLPAKMWVAFAITLCACVLPLFVHNKIYYYVQMIANVLVLGFWCGQFLDYSLMLKYLSFGMSFPAGMVAVLMLIAAFILPMAGSPRHYCMHVCPLGSAQILAGKISRYKLHIGPRTLRGLDIFRKILWCVLMLLLWTDVFVKWMDWELFQAFLFESAPITIIIVTAVMIALSIIVPRPYCRFICPTGTLFRISEGRW